MEWLTRRCSEREPADSLRDKFNAIGGWLPSLTFAFAESRMPKTFLERRWGGGGADPKEADLRAALAELAEPDVEHPDYWLSDEAGWTVAAYQSGRVVLENPESDEGPWHMTKQTHEQIMDLWRLLQLGDLESIRRRPWLAGYGASS